MDKVVRVYVFGSFLVMIGRVFVFRSVLIVSGIMVLVFSSSASFADDIPVAVVEMVNLGGVDPQSMDKANEVFLNSIEKIGTFRMIDRSRVKNAMSSKKKCTDDPCLASAGKSLGARWLAIGSVMKFGRTYVLKLRLIDVKMGRSVTSTTNQIKNDWTAVLTMLPRAVSSLFSSAAPQINPSGMAVHRKKPVHHRTRKEQKKVDEFERMLAKAEKTKELKERMKNAWQVALRLATDEEIHVDVRRHALSRFMHKFRKNNPYYRTAYEMWKDLQPATLEINTLPQGAMIAINGTVVGSAPLRREVQEGKYRIVASRMGFLNSAQTISVSKGQSAVVSLLLPRKVHGHPFNTWGHVTFWSGLGLAAFGGASMGLAVKYANDFETSGSTGDKNNSYTWSTMMWLGFGAGAVLMTSGVILWLLEPPASERVDKSTLTSLVPTPDGQGAVLSISGTW